MVKVIDFLKRKAEDGSEFFVLVLQGSVEFVKSQQTGKFYVTARKCSIPTTFNEHVCQSMIGQDMPGNIVKVESAPYDYVIPETVEVIQLTHSYEFVPEGEEETVAVRELLKDFRPSKNGQLADVL